MIGSCSLERTRIMRFGARQCNRAPHHPAYSKRFGHDFGLGGRREMDDSGSGADDRPEFFIA
jgi:hypothetical protein